MNDDELIERLRRTLRAEADAVTPMHGTPRITPPGRRHLDRVLGVPARVVAGVAVAAAVAAAVTVAVAVHGHAPDQTTVVAPAAGHRATAGHQRTTTPTTAPRPAISSTTPPTAPATTVPPTTAPPTTAPVPADPVPAGFAARSVTFVSQDDGWVLGTDPCGTLVCTSIAATTDRGATWHVVTGPAVPAGAAAADDLQIRFATPQQGWVYDTAAGDGQVWSTDSGGAQWSDATVPDASGATVDDLEAANGAAVVAVTTGDGAVQVDASGASGARFTPVGTIPAPAGGAASTATVVLQGASGWVLAQNDRGVTGGLRTTGGAWSSWTAPCATLSAPALLAASDPSDLVAVCQPSGFGGPTTPSLDTSDDGGSTFAGSGTTPDAVSVIATPVAGTVVGASSTDPGTLVATIGAAAWTTVYPGGGGAVLQVGFESATRGIAVLGDGTLLMTDDGGARWQAVSFGAGALSDATASGAGG